MLKIVVVAVVLIQNLDAQTPSGLQIACNAAETIQRDISRMMTYLTLNTENFGRYISNVTNYINSNLENSWTFIFSLPFASDKIKKRNSSR
ncbi:uncharacterized protein LOC123016343 isoform X2 [Tribolium madens]|uniref:uncharacterized protein LOC123016343 isoform X2 n=1 Tax=Tribolium madens TaxID=41895 RepID=UPI001CF765E1|nr:uncharacterized protein LOC123016343 isoform X2 [Tribolium madens]